MVKQVAILSVSALAALGVGSAYADPWKAKRHPPSSAYYAEEDYDYARVTHVQPIVREVRIERPVRDCWEETRYDAPRETNVAGRAILGGIIGGVLGHQIGDGDGRRIATAAGAVIGSAAAHRAAVRDRDRAPESYTVERCERRFETAYEERIEGYEVEYTYNGRTYQTRLPYDPGERIRINVAVTPAYRR